MSCRVDMQIARVISRAETLQRSIQQENGMAARVLARYATMVCLLD